MVIPAVGALAGAALTYYGSQQANASNKKLAREQMEFQKKMSREQMGWQERMSNTSYQRAMADMEAAGLNPILAYNQGGASTPAGSAPGGASATMQNEFAPAVSSALDAKRMYAEVDNLKESNKNLQAQNDQIKAQTENTIRDSSIKEGQLSLQDAQLKTEYAQKEYLDAMRELTLNSAKAKAYELPGLKKESEMDESKWGDFFRFMQRLNPLNSVLRR